MGPGYLFAGPHRHHEEGNHNYYDPGVFSSLHIGGNFNNMGYLELKGVSGNILVSNVLHNKGDLKSENGALYALKIINQGKIDVENKVETGEFVKPPAHRVFRVNFYHKAG